jgi:hypothetical protein
MVNPMIRWNWVFSAFILLWALPIGDDEQGSVLPEPINMPSHTTRKPPSPKDLPKRLDSKILNISSNVKIDEKQFKQQFAKQAVALDLRHCLRNSMQSSEGALAVAAQLEKSGQLINIRIIDSEKTLPSCGVEIISSMNFRGLVPPIEAAEHTIYWRIEW